MIVSSNTEALTLQAIGSVVGRLDLNVIVNATLIVPVVGEVGAAAVSELALEGRAWLNADKLNPSKQTQTRTILGVFIYTPSCSFVKVKNDKPN